MGFLRSIEPDDPAVPAYERAFAARPDVYAAWRGLVIAIRASMDDRTYEVATLGAARALRSTYCSLAHGALLLDSHVDEDGLRRLVAATDGRDIIGASDRDEAVIAFAARVARGARHIDERDVAALRAHGLDDDEVLDVVLTAAARCFFSTVLDATGTRSDPGLSERLPHHVVTELATGRPPG